MSTTQISPQLHILQQPKHTMADPKDNAQPRREYSVDNFDLDNFDATAAQADLQAIHLCCLLNELNEGDEAGQPPTNHWVLCLQTSETSSLNV